jgi:hypothetical protein
MPLNVIPSFIVQGLQASVALKRIEAFLGEEEVPPEVSSLKRDVDGPSLQDDNRLGVEGGTFRWVESNSTSRNGMGSNGGAYDARGSHDEHKFELSNISIVFPPGKLTVVTGERCRSPRNILLYSSEASHGSFRAHSIGKECLALGSSGGTHTRPWRAPVPSKEPYECGRERIV